MPDSVTKLLDSGPPGTKINIAVLGDGFAAGDQNLYNAKVDELLIDGVFAHDSFYEDKSAFNVYRVNLISAQSGVSTRVWDDKGTPDTKDDVILSTTLRNTALGYIYSGSIWHCYVEEGAKTATLVNNALTTWVPDPQITIVLLNDQSFGGCGGNGRLIMPLGAVTWAVMAHELGHAFGGLVDEYCGPLAAPTTEPPQPNVTVNSARATLKWKGFVAPATPVPTGDCENYTAGPKPAGWSDTQDVGLFEGAALGTVGVYRPARTCRMRQSETWVDFCPVCYTTLKTKAHPKSGHSFGMCRAGDFNGDGRDDLLVHSRNSILIYRSNGSQLDIAFSAVGLVPGSWQFSAGDQFFVGDFNGDGKDEVVVFNGTNWSIPYLGLLVDDGNGGLRLIWRADGSLPGWQMTAGDKFLVANYTADNDSDDLLVFNGTNWSFPYLGMLASTGSGFFVARRYDGSLPQWQMTPGDRFYVGDFNGDGKDDLFVHNVGNWSIPYLAMMRSDGAQLSMVQRFDSLLTGWQMAPGDRVYVGDFDADGKDDLFVFNGSDWSMAYLGMLASNGTGLASRLGTAFR